jgi:Ca-activated chloride channel family protein
MQTKVLRSSVSTSVAIAIVTVLAGCSSAAPATSIPTAAPSAAASLAATPSPAPSAAATSAASTAASAAPQPSGPATLDAPASVGIGVVIDVTWTGPNATKDYITVVPVGATRWTNEPYAYTSEGSPAKVPAPTKVGDYEIWYVSGADQLPTARRPITVTTFVGTLDGPAEVMGGAPFKVAWTGPNGPGDYITVAAAGATRWTNESYFYTKDANPGTLVPGVQAGAYEIWYVTGTDPSPQARRPITVTPTVVTLEFPAKVKAGANFSVKWTGPNGPSDYLTIVPKGSPDGTYTNYAYTASGATVTLLAPDKTGDYEIWYASDRVPGVFARSSIIVE